MQLMSPSSAIKWNYMKRPARIDLINLVANAFTCTFVFVRSERVSRGWFC